jgi:Rieske Fe-S protein
MSETGRGRRGFLRFCTGALLTLLGLLVAVPVVRYLWAPLLRRDGAGGDGPAYVDVGPLADLPQGEWRLRVVEAVQQDGWKQTRVRHSIWVRRDGEGVQGIKVLSSLCPHLGCPINWHLDQSRFDCPCHGGVFDATGRQVSGPPPRSMDPLDFQVRAGRLWVRWQEFRIGLAERVPVYG